MSLGIKVSKPGLDVNTSATKDNVFDSNINTLKTIPSLFFTGIEDDVSVDRYLEFEHNLDYVPVYLEFHKHGTEWKRPFFQMGLVSSTKYSLYWSAYEEEDPPDKVSVYCFLRPFDTTSDSLATTNKFGIFSSKAGHNAISDLPITDMTFDSNYEHWMILKTLSFSVNITAPADPPVNKIWNSTKQAHGLSFTPAVLASGKFYTNGTYRVYPYFESYDENNYRFAEVIVDSTDIWLRVTETFSDYGDGTHLMEGDTVIVATTVTAKVKVFNAKVE